MPNKLWVEKYRPTKVKDYIFQNEDHQKRFTKFIEDNSIPHLLLSGHRGTGKTTLAFILKNELEIADTDFKVLNASDENSIDIIRNNIKSFAQTLPMGEFKIVFMDEADYLTPNAQAALRRMMEEYSETVRFILTCNKPHKIIPEIKSRVQEFVFNEFNKKKAAAYAIKMLKAEGIEFEAEKLIEYVKMTYPDMRKMIQMLQQNTVDGVLQDAIENSDTVKTMAEVTVYLAKDDWITAREKVIETIADDEWEECYEFLYEYLDELGKFKDVDKWKQGIIIIADHLYKHSLVSNPEINFSACMIRLSEV
jgi:DNA polymerase III delta prime subunit